MKIQLVDLQKQYQSIRSEIDTAVHSVLDNAHFIQGEEIDMFEKEFALYLNQKKAPKNRQTLECASCGNGTDAISLALRALGIRPGDEVITVSHTFIATAEAISSLGAIPVFVDIDEKTFLIDPMKIVKAITQKTKAIIPVHLYGQACDMDAIMRIAQMHQLYVVEDCAQAHGATWNGTPVGFFGDAGCFSFYPGKNLGAYGDAGAVVSRYPEVVKKVRLFANHGRLEKYQHLVAGVNSRLDTIQASILRVKLRYLDLWNQLRNEHAQYYSQAFTEIGFQTPFVNPKAKSVWHLYVLRILHRDDVLKTLKEKGIQAGIHYPIPLHLQPAYAYLGYKKGDLPFSEKAADLIISLPLYPEMNKNDLDSVVEAVGDFAVSITE